MGSEMCIRDRRFESLYDGTFTRKFEEEIVSGGLLLNRIREFFQAPRLFIHDLTPVFGDNTAEFACELFELLVRKDRSGNENGFVIVHKMCCLH